MLLHLHNPTSEAHLEDLRDRIAGALPPLASDRDRLRVERLVEVVRAMDEGHLTPRQAAEAFARDRLPGFCLDRWLADMVDEGVYVERSPARRAA
ncbi:hypothetical protein [Rubellimicrobium aerolatum]|uniref:Uncharacterized protein n=1 Tax=Rubellimicrobium aerolatum TaxID=490979 RepID=A0ABW0SA58_9RHOB|nr:hypothetical protein [Rubellimicrobium aerolatum]MBP1805217.1 hypothetical protein [Rubellimicrobium aerolatum]